MGFAPLLTSQARRGQHNRRRRGPTRGPFQEGREPAMTPSTSPRPAGATPTRKQLEELDALLQRMLDVPAAPAAKEEALPAPTPRPAPRTAAPIPRPVPVVPVLEAAAPE